MRNVLVCIDMSENMSDKDLRPTRLDVVLAAVRVFVDDFFSQNPISHLGLMILRRGTAEVITGLSGSKSRHVRHPAAVPATAAGPVLHSGDRRGMSVEGQLFLL